MSYPKFVCESCEDWGTVVTGANVEVLCQETDCPAAKIMADRFRRNEPHRMRTGATTYSYPPRTAA